MSLLFEPVKIGNFEIKNRFVRSATYYALSDENGFITEAYSQLMKTLAENGVGLIMTGFAYVLKNGQIGIDMNGIQDDDHIPGYREITQAVHERDGRIVMQIVHGRSGVPPRSRDRRRLHGCLAGGAHARLRTEGQGDESGGYRGNHRSLRARRHAEFKKPVSTGCKFMVPTDISCRNFYLPVPTDGRTNGAADLKTGCDLQSK